MFRPSSGFEPETLPLLSVHSTDEQEGHYKVDLLDRNDGNHLSNFEEYRVNLNSIMAAPKLFLEGPLISF